jgi:hypothetical protein
LNQPTDPTALGLGAQGSFGYETSGGTTIQSVVLLAPASLTHHADKGQRYVKLGFSIDTSSESALITVTIPTPANVTVCPQGYYLMFLVNSQGAWSTGKWLRIV